MSVEHDDEDHTLDEPAPSRLPKPPRLPKPTSPQSPMAVTTRPIPRSQAPDMFEDEGNFEGDDPPTTAEPIRDDHHPQIVPRSPSVPTRPVPKFRSHDTGDFDDDANPTMIDPNVPTGGAPRTSFDPHARIDDNRRTTDLGPAARRASADSVASAAPDPRRDLMPTAPIRKPSADPLTTAPMGSGVAAGSSPPARREGARKPPGPTGPMLRPPPDAPPALSSTGSRRAIGSGRASGPQRALSPSPPPAFVADRRAAMSGQPVRTVQDPPYDGAPPPAPLRAFGAPPSQAAPTMLQRPAQSFDPHGRIDDSSRTHRWEGRPADAPYPNQPAPMPPPMQAPMQAISHKSPDDVPRPMQHRQVPQVQIRSMSDLSKTPPGGMGRLAPPHDPNQARSRKTQDVMIWASVVVIIGSIVTLVIWLIAR